MVSIASWRIACATFASWDWDRAAERDSIQGYREFSEIIQAPTLNA